MRANFQNVEIMGNRLAITFAVKNKAPRFIEVFDADDNTLKHNFSMAMFNKLAC